MPEVQTQFAPVIEEARNRYLPYPLVLVDDKLAMAGEVSVYGLSMLVGRKLGWQASAAWEQNPRAPASDEPEVGE